MILGTEFSTGLAQVKAETLSGSGRVRSGPGRVTGLRHFHYLGVVRLARLGSGYDSGYRVKLKCHTRFLHQNQVLIVCITQDQLFNTYNQKCS
jgi:hypothetical protein